LWGVQLGKEANVQVRQKLRAAVDCAEEAVLLSVKQGLTEEAT